MADTTVTVYTDRDYQGKSQELKPGAYDATELQGGEDTISSVRVPEGWTVCLYEDPNFGGRAKFLTASTGYVGDEFNDTTSSIIVTDQLPPATARSGGGSITIEQNDIDVDEKSLLRLTQRFPPKYEQIMVLSFTMTIDQPQ